MVDVEKENKAIEKLVKNAFEAENRHDLEEFLDFFADDVIIQACNTP